MKSLHLLFFLLLVGWATCACNLEEGKRYRMVNNCPINRMFRPLCGTDGCSYINDDALACAQKENPQLRVAHAGECEDEAEQATEGNEVL